ncbi:type II toxin-antitoxin system RelE/ParE family toxin [Hydrogenivirga sp.]
MKSLEIHEQFAKDVRSVKLRAKHLERLLLYVSLLLSGKSLPPEAKDHALKGKLRDVRDFHLGGDIVVLYRVEEDRVQLLRIGSHSKVLGI